MLKSRALACEIVIKHLCHHALKDKHTSKHIAAVTFSFQLIEGTMCQYLTQFGAWENLAKVIIERILPNLEFILRTWLLCIQLYLFYIYLSGWRESNPRLRTGGTPNQDLKSCVLPLHYTRMMVAKLHNIR